MDTLTHIVLGACIGEVVAGRQLGKKALLLGAIAQNIPDIDFVASFWLPPAADLLAHRGFTHSFLFAALAAPLLAWLCVSAFSKRYLSFRQWLFFWGLQIFIHDFIDAFNAYGTGWFEPFSHYRITFNAIFVADPLFSLWPAIALIVLVALNAQSNRRKTLAAVALGTSTLYLMLCLVSKSSIDKAVDNNLQNRHTAYNRYFTTPTPLNTLLWYIVAESDSGYYVGYRSVLDQGSAINFHYVSRNDSLLQPYRDREDVRQLLRFSEGYHTTEAKHDTLLFNDLRFGEIAGWPEPEPDFVFHYYLQYPDDNKLLVQRGRFAKWDKRVLGAFLKRIRGN